MPSKAVLLYDEVRGDLSDSVILPIHWYVSTCSVFSGPVADQTGKLRCAPSQETSSDGLRALLLR